MMTYVMMAAAIAAAGVGYTIRNANGWLYLAAGLVFVFVVQL